MVAQVKQTQDVDVIGEVPYYYLIEFYDPEADERVRGYISKRSVKPTENSDEPTDVGRTSMEWFEKVPVQGGVRFDDEKKSHSY